jgi:hypothetical protein
MFRIIIAVIVVVIMGILGVAATKPDTFTYERKITINAPAEKIFPYINDFKNWLAWSPYEKKDPAMKRTYGAATVGKGAGYEWDGNDDIGAGRMDITNVTEPSRIEIRLEFFRPFEAVNTAVFTLSPVAGGTEVSWAMSGEANFISKIMCVFFDVDKMVGNDFEQGLAALKALGESGG